ncbi:MAG: universal stress protein [Magnetococcales bacterium]|nr:universal stress protein [Magnetococcales bacterium]
MNEAAAIHSQGPFFNILLATDGSPFSLGAERLAAALARTSGGKVTAMQAALFDPSLESLGMGIELLQEQENITWQSLCGVQARMEREEGCSCDLLIKRGQTPHEEIMKAADEIGADLVVMGRRGRRGLARLMLGDSTARVVAQSHRAVLVVPKDALPWNNSTLLLATDGSACSERASQEAVRLAKRENLPLQVISVVESKNDTTSFKVVSNAVEGVVARARSEGVAVEGMVLEGHPIADVIADAAAACKAGLVIGGSHGRTGLGKVFIGSVMERLLGRVSCPVLVYKQ